MSNRPHRMVIGRFSSTGAENTNARRSARSSTVLDTIASLSMAAASAGYRHGRAQNTAIITARPAARSVRAGVWRPIRPAARRRLRKTLTV